MSNSTFGVSREERQRRYQQRLSRYDFSYRVSDFNVDPILANIQENRRRLRGADLTQHVYGFYPPSTRDYSRRRSNHDVHVQPYRHRQTMRDVPHQANLFRMRRAAARARARSRQRAEASHFRSINDRYGGNIY